MIRYTTPTFTLRVEGVDLTAMASVVVTFAQGGTTINVEGPTVALDHDDTIITCSLSQTQTASFSAGLVDIQVNWIDGNGARAATSIKQAPVGAQLLPEVR